MKKPDFFQSDSTAQLISAIDDFNQFDELKVINALQSGAHVCTKSSMNTALTQAIISESTQLIDFILETYGTNHPIFSLHDSRVGNTPLSLALKKGHYDLAEKLINKNCDINGMIGHEEDKMHPLHLCAFLLGTFHGEDNAKDAQLINIIKMILRSPDVRLDDTFWGKTPIECLSMDILPEDFDIFSDERNYFEFYLNNPYTVDQIQRANRMDDLSYKIKRGIGDISQLELDALTKEFSDLKEANLALADDFEKFSEYQNTVSDFRLDTMATSEEISVFTRELASRQPEFAKMERYTNRTKEYSHEELNRNFKDNIPDKFRHYRGGNGTNQFYPYIAFRITEHCIWHRIWPQNNCRAAFTDRRNHFFASAEGKSARDELSRLMEEKMRPRLEP